ncbi:MAG: hypothetical protein QXU18_08705 [Thermoplasmatales archaeon]
MESGVEMIKIKMLAQNEDKTIKLGKARGRYYVVYEDYQEENTLELIISGNEVIGVNSTLGLSSGVINFLKDSGYTVDESFPVYDRTHMECPRCNEVHHPHPRPNYLIRAEYPSGNVWLYCVNCGYEKEGDI